MRKIFISDEEYPGILRNIHDPPESFYIKGEILPEDDIAIGIVGSRRATIYGVQTCEKLAYELASRGITIVSGMARGIDSAAHRGALKAGGRTIAVLGCGINIVYPPENKLLADKIQKQGAVISEFAPDTEPFSFNFPKRNRIISGLSLGVVVIEAAQKSGALITASCALEQNREVFAVPGKVNSATSFGTHKLIKEGAKLVGSAEDIIEELNITIERNSEAQEELHPKLKLEGEESRVYSLLSDEPSYIDDISERSGLLLNQVSGILLNLQLKKLVKEKPGKLYYKEQ